MLSRGIVAAPAAETPVWLVTDRATLVLPEYRSDDAFRASENREPHYSTSKRRRSPAMRRYSATNGRDRSAPIVSSSEATRCRTASAAKQTGMSNFRRRASPATHPPAPTPPAPHPPPPQATAQAG